jgi:hypothetical protein
MLLDEFSNDGRGGNPDFEVKGNQIKSLIQDAIALLPQSKQEELKWLGETGEGISILGEAIEHRERQIQLKEDYKNLMYSSSLFKQYAPEYNIVFPTFLDLIEKICNNNGACENESGETIINCPKDCETTIDVEKSLVAHYKFEDDVKDSVGNHQGYNNGASFVESLYGKAISFNSGDIIGVVSSPSLNFKDEVTFSAWIQTSSNDVNIKGIVERMQIGGSYFGVELGLQQSKVCFHAGGTYTSNLLCGNEIVNDGEWHHVVGIYDGTNSLIYVDGKLDKSEIRTNNIHTPGENLNIGSNYNQKYFFKGIIDEVKIWNYALSEDEVIKEFGISSECESTGLRQLGKYCSFDKTWINQKAEEEICENNFECETNVCVDDVCISAGLFRRFLEWLKALF